MKIAIDMMGGDFAPENTVDGVILAKNQLPENVELILIGKKPQIQRLFHKKGVDHRDFNIVHAKDIVEMGEHPTKAIAKKPKSSIMVGYHLLKEGKVDAFVSAGNTGAMLVGAVFTIKTIQGVIRPTVLTIVPKESGKFGVLADVGANADCKPDVLAQFGMLGSLYAMNILKIKHPKVGLLNIGEEEQKGTLLSQAAFPLFKLNSNLNFIGNIEGRDLFNPKADVVVSDGFTGNIVMKILESVYDILLKRGLMDEYFSKFNYEDVGGCPILGVNGVVLVGHGNSSGLAIKNMIVRATEMIKTNIVKKISQAFK